MSAQGSTTATVQRNAGSDRAKSNIRRATDRELQRLLRTAQRPVVVPLGMLAGLGLLLFLCSLLGGFLMACAP